MQSTFIDMGHIVHPVRCLISRNIENFKQKSSNSKIQTDRHRFYENIDMKKCLLYYDNISQYSRQLCLKLFQILIF